MVSMVRRVEALLERLVIDPIRNRSPMRNTIHSRYAMDRPSPNAGRQAKVIDVNADHGAVQEAHQHREHQQHDGLARALAERAATAHPEEQHEADHERDQSDQEHARHHGRFAASTPGSSALIAA